MTITNKFSDPLEITINYQWDPLSFLPPGSEDDNEISIPEMEEIAHESVSILHKYGHRLAPLHEHIVQGEEVGDDRVDITLDAIRGATILHVQSSIMQMVTSEEDTNLSNQIWNFCEVSGGIPTARNQDYHYCRNTSSFQNLGYTDVPPLRILMDVSKGDMSHSSTTAGKVTMLGNRMRTPKTEFLPIWNLASFLQDGLLRTSRSSEPKYLPQVMGGSGCRALYQSDANLYLSVRAYRGGKYERIYGSACTELRQCLASMELDQAQMPILCSRLRDKQEYLHGTYAEKIFVPTRTQMDRERNIMPMPLIEASAGANEFSSYENRLLRTRHLVPRSVAEQEWSYTGRIREQLLNHLLTVPETDSILREMKTAKRKQFGMALNANSAFVNLLERKASPKDVKQLINDDFICLTVGQRHFTSGDAHWISSGGKSSRFSIEDVTPMQDLFLRSEVSEEETFKVGGIPLRPIIGLQIKPMMTTTKIGLYQINSSMTEWADQITERLTQDRDKKGKPLTSMEALAAYGINREWVNDDTTLIRQCLHDTRKLHQRSARVMLVSADKRLGNQMANTCNVVVYLASPTSYIKWCKRTGNNFQSETAPDSVTEEINLGGRKDPIRKIYLDTGSISSAAALLQEGDEDGMYKLYKRSSERGTSVEGKRSCTYNLHIVDIHAKLEYMVIYPVNKQKSLKFHETTRGLYPSTARSVAESSTSWRSVKESMPYRYFRGPSSL